MIGGRNDWLRAVEEMKTWVIWTLRVVVVGFWVTIALMIVSFVPSIHIDR